MLYVRRKLENRKYFSIFAALMIDKRNRYEENNNIRHRMAVATLPCLPIKGQGKVVPLKYGNMDHWVVRNIKESASLEVIRKPFMPLDLI